MFSPSFLLAEADLRVGEVQWGDSGVYICKVVISDDLEGQNEASVELLVLGKMIQKNLWKKTNMSDHERCECMHTCLAWRDSKALSSTQCFTLVVQYK